jgi:hypothetical protein
MMEVLNKGGYIIFNFSYKYNIIGLIPIVFLIRKNNNRTGTFQPTSSAAANRPVMSPLKNKLDS